MPRAFPPEMSHSPAASRATPLGVLGFQGEVHTQHGQMTAQVTAPLDSLAVNEHSRQF